MMRFKEKRSTRMTQIVAHCPHMPPHERSESR
jgi:hypothetical protein